jgi:hypothetical protein
MRRVSLQQLALCMQRAAHNYHKLSGAVRDVEPAMNEPYCEGEGKYSEGK